MLSGDLGIYGRDILRDYMKTEYGINLKNYNEAIKYGLQALNITERKYSYINEIFSWNETIYDILSLCYYNLNQKKEGLKYLKIALNINPNDKRLHDNLKYFY